MKGKISLAEARPELAAQWHPTKNGDLTPEMVTRGARQKAWWLLPYDDPETGKHFDFEWEAKIADRSRGIGCPFLSGKAAWPGYNDLATIRPKLAAQWHPTKNEGLTPEMVTCGSNKEAWWLLPYDDPETGKHFDLEWQAKIAERVGGYGCPYISGYAVLPGFNDLSSKRPALAVEWHPTKNGDLTLDKVYYRSNQKAWWLLPYDDPETGKHFDFEWEALIISRTDGAGCPFLAGNAVWPGYNDLATKYPNLAAEWHPTKNGDLTPDKVISGSVKKAWWLLSYDDPETCKHFDFEWEARIARRTKGDGCPFLAGKAAYPGYNDLASKRPDLAAQWHPTKNGDLTPDKVTYGSQIKVWWFLPCDDPATGKHFDFEWEATVANRTSGYGCPFLAGTSVWPGYNDLATKRPDIVAEWHPTKNGSMTPDKVTSCSETNVWWLLSYDDPETGKHFDFEWEASISKRTSGNGCPFLSGRAVWPGYNDLATKRPSLAAQWHPTKNGSLSPKNVTVCCTEKAWWYLPYDDPETGRHFDFEWEAGISSRSYGDGCPFLSGHAVWPGFNDLATKCPELATQWHPTKNGALTPAEVYYSSLQKAWWLQPYDDSETGKHFDFEWEATIHARSGGTGCPYLSGNAIWVGFNDLASRNPELAAQWHPTKNGDLTPEMVTCGCTDKVWWLLPYDDPDTGKHFDFEWEAPINARSGGTGCPYLSGHAVMVGFNDLATRKPELAAQWHPTKNGDLTPEMVTCGCTDKMWWLLPYDDPDTGKNFDFEWEAPINARSGGTGCPYLSGHAIWVGFNDLASRNPELAAQWHPTKNGDLTPEMVTCGCPDKVWWLLPYDDPETGKHFDFEWKASITGRSRNTGCPYLTGRGTWPGYNDLKTKRPDLAAEWHPTRNRRRTPDKVYYRETTKAWWLCPQCGYEWRAAAAKRVCVDELCPACKKRMPRFL